MSNGKEMEYGNYVFVFKKYPHRTLEPSVFLVQTRKSLTSVLNWEKRMRVSLLHFAEKESHDIRRFMAEKIFLSEWY